ncbi:universal stress protein [Streptomyces sp. NBC_01190]|uniref:universal stress protein n=1 Tax=Streptomyces sp. NBC_01190 TaxID=2903767 RepID=UPI00386A6DF5|nr:universal stress protein [Streptomyces sp. NBC_01190]
MAQGGRVVVGVSGSLRSLAALHRAVDEARGRDAELLVVMAWTPPGGEMAYHRSPCPPLLRSAEDGAADRLARVFREALGGVPRGVAVRAVVVRGDAGAALVRIADRADDLLVVGTGRQGGIRRLVHGAVSRHCLSHAACAVLAVPPLALMRDLERGPRSLVPRPLGRTT